MPDVILLSMRRILTASLVLALTAAPAVGRAAAWRKVSSMGPTGPKVLQAETFAVATGIYFAVQASYEQQLVNANQQALTAAVKQYRAAYAKELARRPALLRTATAPPAPRRDAPTDRAPAAGRGACAGSPDAGAPCGRRCR